MEFFDGVPLPATVDMAHDALDLLRGIDVFLNRMPGTSMLAMRNGLRSVGARSNVIACTDPRSTSAPVVLTANTETTYGTTFLDLKTDGPTVIECPANSLGFVDDLWQRYVADMGNAGPDRGQGGKYLFLPPGHDGDAKRRWPGRRGAFDQPRFWCGKLPLYPKLIVPLQIDLAIGGRRHLFGSPGTCGPEPEPMFDYSDPAYPVVVSRTLARAGSVVRTKGPASATGLGIKGRRRKPLPCHRAVRNAIRASRHS